MSSQTPITDEIQGYGVLDNAIIENFRAQELSGALTQEDLFAIRENIVDLQHEQVELLKSQNELLQTAQKASEEMNRNMYNAVESIDASVDQESAASLLDNIEK